ncbi:AMIN domain-containing protein [Pleurocapsales cyanobacterium LEGE 06147]|nr:AMIN domain-containing protein [Pleurocapsales cyanobacterium LEGE 06147]
MKNLVKIVGWSGAIAFLMVQPALTGEQGRREAEEIRLFSKNKAFDLIAQGVTRVTEVQVNQTDDGLEVILETPTGEQLVPLILPEDNNLVIEILDATLALPTGN